MRRKEVAVVVSSNNAIVVSYSSVIDLPTSSLESSNPGKPTVGRYDIQSSDELQEEPPNGAREVDPLQPRSLIFSSRRPRRS